MTCNNQTLSPACEDCNALNSTAKSHFTYRRFVADSEIAFSRQEAHLLFILEGEIEITDEEESHVCSTGEMALIAFHKEYQVKALTEVRVLVHTFTKASETCDNMHTEVLRDITSPKEYHFNTLKMHPPMLQFAESVISYLNKDVCCDYLNQAKVMELFIVCRFFYSLEEMGRFFYPILYKDMSFTNLVKANYAKAKNVKELADLCGYTYDNFKKVFAAHFDLPPYQWMMQQKSGKIKSRLMDKSVSIKYIAAEFGFVDQAHLNAFCKRYLKASPSQIRANIQ